VSFLINKNTKPRILLATFFIRMTMKVKWILLAYVVTQASAAVVFMFIEGWTFLEGIWWGQVASLTIGYGDIAPKTILGRLIAGPFHYFWVYYVGLSLGAHIIAFLWRNKNELTHAEQEWLFDVVTVIFNRVRWCTIAMAAVTTQLGIKNLPEIPHTTDGQHDEIPVEASDTDYGNITDAKSFDEQQSTVSAQ
jgi:hypothetical protein